MRRSGRCRCALPSRGDGALDVCTKHVTPQGKGWPLGSCSGSSKAAAQQRGTEAVTSGEVEESSAAASGRGALLGGAAAVLGGGRSRPCAGSRRRWAVFLSHAAAELESQL